MFWHLSWILLEFYWYKGKIVFKLHPDMFQWLLGGCLCNVAHLLQCVWGFIDCSTWWSLLSYHDLVWPSFFKKNLVFSPFLTLLSWLFLILQFLFFRSKNTWDRRCDWSMFIMSSVNVYYDLCYLVKFN